MRRLAALVAAGLLVSACNPCVRVPPRPSPSSTTTTVHCPASATPGPGLTEPESPNYDPNWKTNYPEVWC